MKRVGLTPLKQHIFTESSGSSPTQTTLFYGIEWVTLPSQNYIYCKFMRQAPYFLSSAQNFTHSFWSFLQKRVGTIPLEPHFFIKASGADPTQTAYFYGIEWVKPRSNYIFLWNRVGQAPLKLHIFTKSSGSSPARLLFPCQSLHTLIKITS